MKLVVNRCLGTYRLSPKAYAFLGIEWDGIGRKFKDYRENEDLVKCVETLGEEANGDDARLKVIEIPDDVAWMIYENYGCETIEIWH